MNVIMNKLNFLASKFFLIRIYKYYVIDSIIIVKKYGFKELLKQRGLKFFLIIITYYALRDTLVYILIPLLIAKGIFN
ncbi:MAG: hypothetical protein Kow0098_28350 [Ignavibacteriaceae bacterium]